MPEIIKVKYQNAFKLAAINAGITYEVPIPTTDVQTHNFFNDIMVVNTDVVDVEVTPNNDSSRTFPVPAKTAMGFSFKDDNMRFSTLKVKNLHGSTATTADKVIVLIAKKRIENTNE